MGLCFMTVSAMHGGTATVAREEVQRLAHDLGYKAWPDPNTLKAWLWVSAILYGLASVGLGIIIFWPTMISRLGF
jgi:hypothetical protein